MLPKGIQVLLIFAVLDYVSCGAALSNYFNCDRTEDNICENGNCTAGFCDCEDGFTGYDCSIEVILRNTTNWCGCEQGTCLEDGSCKCGDDYYGGICEFRRLDVLCAVPDKFIINVNLKGSHDVYVDGMKDSCQFLNVTDSALSNIPPGWEGKAREIGLTTDNDCGVPVGDDQSKSINVIIQFLPNVLTILDINVTFDCSSQGSDVIIGNVLPVDDLFEVPSESEAPTADLVAASQETGTGAVIPNNAPRNVGDSYWLKFTMTPTPAFTALRIDACSADDAEGGDALVVITDGCILPHLTFMHEIVQVNSTTSIARTSVFKFNGKSKLRYVCDILICASPLACEQPSCLPESTRRRKREARSQGNSTHHLQKTIIIQVTDPFLDKPVIIDENTLLAQCDNMVTSSRMGAVIGLAVLVVALMTSCAVLGVYLLKKLSELELKRVDRKQRSF